MLATFLWYKLLAYVAIYVLIIALVGLVFKLARRSDDRISAINAKQSHRSAERSSSKREPS